MESYREYTKGGDAYPAGRVEWADTGQFESEGLAVSQSRWMHV